MITLASLLLLSQVHEVRVTSEFRQDTGGREILSPALPRNAWTTFHVVLTGPPSTEFSLHIGQNPEDFLRVRLLRDGKELELPFDSILPVDGKPAVFQLDVFASRAIPVRRMKLEPQVFMQGYGWVTYPMEGRVMGAIVPATAATSEGATYLDGLRAHLCGAKSAVPRNLAQDLALARSWAGASAALLKALGAPTAAAWCRDPKLPDDPEWFFRFRDPLYRATSGSSMP